MEFCYFWSNSKESPRKEETAKYIGLSCKDGLLGDEINQARKEINELLNSEETYWCQRSKAHWLNEVDRNTKFFHARAFERREQNTILGI